MKKIPQLIIVLLLFLILGGCGSSEISSQTLIFTSMEDVARTEYKDVLTDVLILPAKHEISPDLKDGEYKVGTIVQGYQIDGAAIDYNSSLYGTKIVKYMYKNNGNIEYRDGTLKDLLERIQTSNDLIVNKKTSKFRIEACVNLDDWEQDKDIYERITIIFRQIE